MTEKAPEETPKPPESPTTRTEPDFDDEPQETGTVPDRQPAPKRVNFQDEAPPPKPPRPQSPHAQAEATLIEAFPSIDTKVVRAVLMASGGQVEPAFNALLGMSDPDYDASQAQQTAQAPPRRVDSRHPPPRAAMSQIEQDEMYARQLADHYEGSAAYGYGSRGVGNPAMPRRRQEGSLKPNELYDDRERSFLDDDLPAIRDSITKGFQETQKTFNKWISDVRKKLDGDSDEDEDRPPLPSRQRQNYGPSQSAQLYGIQRNAERARSGDRERYDADPRVLGDDFTQLELHDNDPPTKRAQGRPLANPDLFKPLPTGPTPQGGPVDEVDALYRNRTPTERQPSPSAGNGGKKWQPLTSVAPAPEGEDNDPFSLGDSDEEQDKKQDLRPEDTDRLKKSASGTEDTKEDGKQLAAAERSGSVDQKDKTAEELLKKA